MVLAETPQNDGMLDRRYFFDAGVGHWFHVSDLAATVITVTGKNQLGFGIGQPGAERIGAIAGKQWQDDGTDFHDCE